MLTLRSLGILAAITGIVLAGAVLAVLGRQDATVSALRDALVFPDLETRLADVVRVEMSWNKDGAVEQATIAREGGAWRIAEQGGYPADTAKVRDFILSLAELKLLEAKTADPERHARLGVADVSKAGSEATRIRLFGDGETVLLDALIGSDRTSGTGGAMLYVRRGGEDRTWLVLGRVDDVQRVSAWADERVIDIGADRIQEVHLTAPDGEVLEVRRGGEGEQPFELLNMPEGREFATFYIMNEITDGLAALEFEDAQPIEGMRFEPSLGNAIFQTRGGLTVIVEFAEVPGPDEETETWARLSVTAASDAAEEDSAFAAENAERLANWAYKLSGSRLQRLRYTMETATKPTAKTGG